MRSLALFLALVAAGCSLGGEDSTKEGRKLSESELSELVLQQADLGRGYEAFADGRTIRAELSPALLQDPYRFGRQGGWTARYRRLGELRARGISTLVSSVDVFSDSSGAGKFYEAGRDFDAERNFGSGLQEVKAPRIGDGSRTVFSKAAPPGSVIYAGLTWRHGRFVCSVFASGFAGRLRLSDVVALARRQQRKLEEKQET